MLDPATTIASNAAALASRVEALSSNRTPFLAAIAGPPGSGKSTLAEALVLELRRRDCKTALMTMDGFHLDNRLLEPRGLLPRKGAPETFDFGGFFTAVRRVHDGEPVILPVFDRSREIAIAGAMEIDDGTKIVVIEGNYLCFDEDPWRRLAPLWDLSVFLDVPMAELEHRLVERWLSFGFSPEAALAKARSNDIANAERVARAIVPVDMKISGA